MALLKEISSSVEDTYNIAKDFAKNLKINDVVSFFGNLGAGKTTFIKGLLEGLNYTSSEVNSPTFTYLNIYDTKINIFHFDVYRLKNSNNFLDMGFDEYFSMDGICLIEWADIIEDILPKKRYNITINHISDKKREISIEKNI
ncbi:MAG: tRNA threonylcarbamoyladenosine biosynthesis protein TsaE [Candidatus Anoxychlamydiales bacterium]|nr:tRNA threonylcarbamoyladenosine biosynthesis protein TsaE [Candidatus Anoxychlamydiales bacterium]